MPRLYLIRFPLLLAFLLVGFGPFAGWGVPAMFRSMLVLPATGVTVVSLFATLAAFTVMATRRVVLIYGPERFDTPWRPWPQSLRLRNVAGHLALAAPLVGCAVAVSRIERTDSVPALVLGAATGIAAACFFMWGATLLHALAAPPETALPDLAFPRDRFSATAHRAPVTPRVRGPVQRLLRRMQPYLGPGYISPAGDLQPGHGFALTLMWIYGLLYALGYVLWQPGTARGAGVPALAYLLIIATLWTWFLSGAGFYLDRHRVPVLLAVLLGSFLVWTVSRSDFYFRLETPAADWNLLEEPGPIAARRGHPLLVVVAVDGGGIQAAAWAARVLTGIQDAWPDFRLATRFISAVSGGSVGTMYYVSALQAGRPPSAAEMHAVRDLSRRGSLNEAAWGLAYPDLWRALVPVPPRWRFIEDRGWAMQQAWERGWGEALPHLKKDGAFRSPQLSEWVIGVHEGWRPAVSFNAVLVESGKRVALATFFPPYEWDVPIVPQLYPERDLTVSTAARLSATFPYVTPISRARPDGAATGTGPFAGHYADGGYYDNTGMGLAMRWLDRALEHDRDAYRGRAVAFIRVRSAQDVEEVTVKDRGWQYQVVGPLQTMLGVRTAAQRERAKTELDFLHEMWCDRGVEIRRFDFTFVGDAPPLSWQLSPLEASNLERAWKDGASERRSVHNEANLKWLLETAANPTERCPPAVSK